jgi:threonine dehydrogenase-like Zn-dependent dehydrogenase
MPEIKQPDEVMVRVKEVGLDGTDFNMVRCGLQDIAEGRNEMAMGHGGNRLPIQRHAGEMLTHRFRLEDCQQAFALKDPGHIKTVIEVEPWN